MTQEKVSYDEVPYTSFPYPQSHPDRLATVATLFGLSPARVERCRVLELGCAAGGNLIPMAEALPESTFVGVDFSGRQIAEGCRAVAELGLRNIELQHRNILDVGPDLGSFDYVICHGVFSWVPATVQDRILAICQQNLAPQGVAYISYNTLPGWHLRGAVRDMMRFHTRRLETAALKAEQARALLDFLAHSAKADDDPYGRFLRSELAVLQDAGDSYLLHEHLEEHNEPLYFHQFMEQAQAHGLRYLGEVDPRLMLPGNFPPPVAEVLKKLSADVLQLEQYMDFLRNQMFRQTLLCHAEREVSYQVPARRLCGFHIAAALQPEMAGDDDPAAPLTFQGRGQAEVTARDPRVKAALMILADAWPEAVPLPRLVLLARARLGKSFLHDGAEVETDTLSLGRTLLEFHARAGPGVVELLTRRPAVTARPGPRPVARRLARWQARTMAEVTSLRHQVVPLTGVERAFIGHLDGEHDRAALAQVLAGIVERGEATVEEDGEAVADLCQRPQLLGRAVEEQLARFARESLLLG